MARDNSFYKNHPDLEVQDMFGEYVIKTAQNFVENPANAYVDFSNNELGILIPDVSVTFGSGDYIGDVEAKLTVAVSEHLLDDMKVLSENFESDNEEFLKSKGIL